ncbi:hypothetical protein C8J57DRAFT_1538754 [Mycena rebaudengoi]|nr:hypothetical protein C8J57DRAFT_1538754 [Mycena rebaudengoi]
MPAVLSMWHTRPRSLTGLQGISINSAPLSSPAFSRRSAPLITPGPILTHPAQITAHCHLPCRRGLHSYVPDSAPDSHDGPGPPIPCPCVLDSRPNARTSHPAVAGRSAPYSIIVCALISSIESCTSSPTWRRPSALNHPLALFILVSCSVYGLHCLAFLPRRRLAFTATASKCSRALELITPPLNDKLAQCTPVLSFAPSAL